MLDRYPKEKPPRKFMKDRIGEVFKNHKGHSFKIVSLGTKPKNVLIQNESGHKWEVNLQRLRIGEVTDYFKPSRLGVGYIGIAEYGYCQKHPEAYKLWVKMLSKCYKKKTIDKKVIMNKEWHSFYNFVQWYENEKKSGENNEMFLPEIIIPVKTRNNLKTIYQLAMEVKKSELEQEIKKTRNEERREFYKDLYKVIWGGE